jgi:hypothetical protein
MVQKRHIWNNILDIINERETSQITTTFVYFAVSLDLDK